jgi:cell division protein FtsI (penicillin-binding protein 3)
VIAKSSNICAGKIGILLGEAGLYGALKRFGFGETTGLGIPGEAAGVLRARGRPWYEVEVAAASFGQGISVTTIQMAMAMGAIANGGRLLEPMLVKKVTTPMGEVLREEVPVVRRDVIPAFAAHLVTEMMTGVVEEGGTGREAHIPGYRVAGKTATAQKADPSTGKYDPDTFVSSFVGFVPAQRPRFVIAVTIDEPWVAHLGGQVAAPLFRRIAMRALSRFGVAPSGDLEKTPVVFPLEDPTPRIYADIENGDLAGDMEDVTGPGGAVASPLGSGKQPGPGQPPIGQGGAPAIPVNVANAATSTDASKSAPPDAPRVVVPDAMGLAARDAVKLLAGNGLVPVIEGTGTVQKQDPPAGTTIIRGATVKLKLEPST